MKRIKNVLGRRVSRFAVVGVANAAISFSLLNVCYFMLHQGKITASVISTTVALLFSFLMNRNYVFRSHDRRLRKQFLLFIAVTISGSLVLLNAVYALSLRVFDNHLGRIVHLVEVLSGVMVSQSFIQINLSTIIGAVAAMIWNYNGYRLFVFKDGINTNVFVEADDE